MLRSVADRAALRVLPITEPRCQRSLGLAWRQSHYLSQAAQQFRAFVIQYFKHIEQEELVERVNETLSAKG